MPTSKFRKNSLAEFFTYRKTFDLFSNDLTRKKIPLRGIEKHFKEFPLGKQFSTY